MIPFIVHLLLCHAIVKEVTSAWLGFGVHFSPLPPALHVELMFIYFAFVTVFLALGAMLYNILLLPHLPLLNWYLFGLVLNNL